MTDNPIAVTNSAGRLVSLLRETASIGMQSSNNSPYIYYVCSALGLDVSNESQTESFSLFFNLINQTEKNLLLLTPTKIKNHRTTLNNLRTLLFLYCKSSFVSIENLNNHDSYIIRDLENLADSLDEVMLLKLVEEKELENLLNEIDSLYENISSSDIGKDLKFLLLKKIANLKVTIENYRFLGSDGIKEEVENFIGAIFINKNKVKNEKEKNFVCKIFELLSKIATTSSAVKNLLPENINEIVISFLPPNS